MPGITVETAGCERQKRSAMSARTAPSPQVAAQRVDVLHHLLLAIALGNSTRGNRPAGTWCLGVILPVSAPSSSGTRASTPMFSACAQREQIALGRLVEDVVDHLHGVDQAGPHDLERGIGLVVVDRDADGADFAGALQVVEGAAPFVARRPTRAFQTWSCSRSMVASPRLPRLSSAHAMM